MNAGRARNIDGDAYSTPRSGVDAVDGAGAPDAVEARIHCNPPDSGPVHVASGNISVKYGDGDPMPSGDTQQLPGPFTHSLSVKSATSPGPSDGRHSQVAIEIELHTDTRFRFVLSYNACIDGGASTLAGDIDVFLLNTTTNEYIAASQSVDDTNEGFDVIVPSNGVYRVIVGYTKNPTCSEVEEEPSAWTAWWREP